MTEAVAEKRGRRLDGRYTLLDKLGAGGQAEVWRAHDGIRGIDIALKIVQASRVDDEAAWNALEHEYTIASLLSHPAILKVFPPERTGGLLALPLELASGGDLRRLRGGGFLEIIPVLLEVAQALEHAHERGVVHRDLKPGNILFDARGRARLADFGVAEAASKLEAKGEANRETNRHGFSPFTASPAQLRGEAPAPADDIYGLGALAYELLSGYPPYYPRFNKQRAIEEPVPELVPTRQIPPLLNSLVMRMLSKDPALRPGSMREVIDELDAALNDTLTFDFEAVPESGSELSPSSAAQASLASAAREEFDLPAKFAADQPAANMSQGPEIAQWTADAGLERRASTDRRRARREPTVSMPERADGPVDAAPVDAARIGGARVGDAVSRPPQRHGILSAEANIIAPRGATRFLPVSRSPDAVAVPPVPPVPPVSPESTRPAAASVSAPAAAKQESFFAEPESFAPWKEIPLATLPRVSRFEQIPARRWPWVLLGLLVGAAAAVYFWLPRFEPQSLPDADSVIASIRSFFPTDASPASAASPSEAQPAAAEQPEPPPADAPPAAVTAPETGTPSPAGAQSQPGNAVTKPASRTPVHDAGMQDRLGALRKRFDGRLAMLEARDAGAWGGRDFALAKTLAAESVGARDAGNSKVAMDRLIAATRLLDAVESKAPAALSAQIAAGEQALGTGQPQAAGQAFALAHRIDPKDHRAAGGQHRAQSLPAVLPLLADAQNAENAREFARAAQDYSQALALDPGNESARAGQARANAAFGDDNYAKAVGSGFAALGAGRLDEAREAFVKAKALKPRGAEALEGLRRVGAALSARGLASIRQRAAGLEAQERWPEALQAYEAVLSADPSLAFAQEGRARAASRAELAGRMQDFIDHPQQLGSPVVRAEARELLETAHAQTPSGPVLRSQMARLEILLPGFDRPVRLSLLSDNSTQVAIASVGSFGAFARREIQLRPGKYTVVGTRSGFREVRREITVAPGQESQTIRVSCSQPI
ncbi:MAG TPA: protein kinase [Steroidobacteraceae bacterium]